jgi:thymidylate synthase
MYLSASNFDDLLRRVLTKLLKTKHHISPTKGAASEITGVLLQLTNPRARLSFTESRGVLFGCLGELLWYLSKTDSLRFITYYLPQYNKASDDGKTVYGAYGPRLSGMRGHDQIANVVSLLKRRPDSRRAAIQLFDAADLADHHEDVPCTCTIQFLIRKRRLHMIASMRSNDAYLGLPHDIFAFTMIQELVARTLGVELGSYKHAVGSLHLYDSDRTRAQQYVAEGWQDAGIMPPMPLEDPWRSVGLLLKAERKFRRAEDLAIGSLPIDRYWQDLARLLQIFSHFKRKNGRAIATLKRRMAFPIYSVFIEQKKAKVEKRTTRTPQQLVLF